MYINLRQLINIFLIEDTLMVYWLECRPSVPEVVSSNPGSHYSRSLKLTLSLSLAMPEFDKELPSSAHQCTPVVLNYSCCGVAGVVVGLNWPVCSNPALTW